MNKYDETFTQCRSAMCTFLVLYDRLRQILLFTVPKTVWQWNFSRMKMVVL